MHIEAKAREALDLERLRSALPASIPVVKLEVEDYVDSRGEPSLKVLVVIDESTDVEKLSGRDVGELKTVIRASLREHGFELFPYFTLAKPSELAETGHEE